MRGRREAVRLLDEIILPDDGSFSADTHVATQNTGIARTGSMLLRRRRGYVNWGVNSGRRDAVPLCRQPRGRLRATSVPCVRDLRDSSSAASRGDAPEILLFTIGRDSNASATKRKCNALKYVYIRRKPYVCGCTRKMHANAKSALHNELVITFLKKFRRYRNFLESKTSAYFFLRYAYVSRAFIVSKPIKISQKFIYLKKNTIETVPLLIFLLLNNFIKIFAREYGNFY